MKQSAWRLIHLSRNFLKGKRQMPFSVFGLFVGGLLCIAVTNWAVSRWVLPRRQVDIRVKAARSPEVKSREVVEKQIERIERKLNSPAVSFAMRTSEAGQIFTAMVAALVNPREERIAISTNELVNNMLTMQLVPPQCRYVSPAAPENQFRIPLFVSEISGTVYVPYWDRQYLVVGSLPVQEDQGEAFFYRYPEMVNGRKDIAMWMAPTLDHRIVPPNATEVTLKSHGWVKSPAPFADLMTDIDRVRLSLDLIANEKVNR